MGDREGDRAADSDSMQHDDRDGIRSTSSLIRSAVTLLHPGNNLDVFVPVKPYTQTVPKLFSFPHFKVEHGMTSQITAASFYYYQFGLHSNHFAVGRADSVIAKQPSWCFACSCSTLVRCLSSPHWLIYCVRCFCVSEL